MDRIGELTSQIVTGKCPECETDTILVSFEPTFFRCVNCGADLEQHINGKITYLPVMTARADGGVPFVKEWLE